jgi:hypothetical protein
MARHKIEPKPELTRDDIRILSRLVRAEAERIGYGPDSKSPFYPDNKKYWTRELRNLTRVMNKLNGLRTHLRKPPPLSW